VASYFMCSPTDELALERNEGASFFQFSLESYRSSVFAEGGPSLWEQYRDWRKTERGQQLSSYTGGLIGSPETIRRRLRKFEQSNMDMVILLVETGKVRHEHVCASLELFGREVMPEFHEREP